jgi:excisionase family DNA binding protein
MERSAIGPSSALCDNSIAINDRLLSYADVAERMGVSIHTVRGWVYQRKIPYLKAGKIVRFIWADVLQWLHKKGA